MGAVLRIQMNGAAVEMTTSCGSKTMEAQRGDKHLRTTRQMRRKKEKEFVV